MMILAVYTYSLGRDARADLFVALDGGDWSIKHFDLSTYLNLNLILIKQINQTIII